MSVICQPAGTFGDKTAFNSLLDIAPYLNNTMVARFAEIERSEGQIRIEAGCFLEMLKAFIHKFITKTQNYISKRRSLFETRDIKKIVHSHKNKIINFFCTIPWRNIPARVTLPIDS